jgi:hypothetical protein
MLRLRGRVLVAVGCATLLVVAACQAGSRASGPWTNSTAAPPVASGPSTSAGESPQSTIGCGSATISIDYAPYIAASLAGSGWDFVVADVVGFDPATFNTPDGSRPPDFLGRPSSPKPNYNAEDMIYTPVNVEIDRAISGLWSPGPSHFLIEGGTVGCFRMWVSPVPQVKPGSRYVFVLSEALDNGGVKPLPLHKARFAWPVDRAGMVTTIDGRMSIDDLAEIVLGAAPSTEPT